MSFTSFADVLLNPIRWFTITLGGSLVGNLLVTDETNGMPPLGGTKRDFAVAVAKGALGAIPFAGALLEEIVGQIIPEQRIERLERYATELNERLEEFAAVFDGEKVKQPESIDLFEEGAIQASRALSNDRIRYIARVVARGMTGDEKDRIEAKRLLALLRTLDDDQIIILTSYLHRHRHDEFYAKHAAILEPIRAHMSSPQEQHDKETVYQLARLQLKALGLTRPEFRAVKKGEIPEFDGRTGMMKANSTCITPLGRLLLTRLALCEPGEF